MKCISHKAMLLCFLLLVVAATSCDVFMPRLEATMTPTTTLTPTTTIEWFPPIPTSTVAPPISVQPTPDYHPDLAEVILVDDFTDTTFWSTMQKPAGSAAYSEGRLTLAISQPGGNIFSMRSEPVLQDFYWEITSVTSLCRGEDSYGLLVRMNSLNDFYRFMVNCNGLLRVERTRNMIVNTLLDWTSSSQATAGTPITLHWGVWVKGNRFRLFINDVFQFEIKDDAFPSGILGVFARSGGDNVVTVNFSSMQIRLLTDGKAPFTPTPKPTSSATPTP